MSKRVAAYGRVGAVAEYCGVSDRTIRRWMDLGLPYSKPDPSQQGVVLIRWEDLEKWLSENTR